MTALANDLSALGRASREFLGADHQHFINGRFIAGATGKTLPVIDPTSGLEVGAVPAGDAADVDAAVKAARRAFDEGPWRKMRGADRERLLLRLADLLEANAAEIS